MSEAVYWTLVHADQVPHEDVDSFLSSSEILKFSSMRFPKRRQEWLLGRYAAKRLAHSLPPFQEISLVEIEIQNTSAGAPFLVGSDGEIFAGCLSLSHCGSQVLCGVALCPGLHLGVDLEHIEERSSAFIQDYFTPAEQELLEGIIPAGHDTAVNLLWSMKESMLKALGVGLHWDTRKVEIKSLQGEANFDPGTAAWEKMQVDDHSDQVRSWQAWWQVRQDHVLTAAVFSEPQSELDSLSLIEKCF